MPILRLSWIQHYGQIIRQEANLDSWVRIATVTHLPLGKDFLTMDDFWSEAVSTAVNSYVKEQNDQQSKSIKDMESRLESLKPQQSSFSGIPMPSFNQR